MSNQSNVVQHSFSVGRRYRCTMSFFDGDVNVEWQPRKPNDLRKREVRDYRAGRDEFIKRAMPGVKAAVVEY